ncbi:MAG: cysteine hydrolase [Clostridiales bacterium]|nr:cysteine hydrolase [Clostridiales bacterium]
MQKVLIVVDMQHDFVDGVLGTPEALAIVDNVKEKIQQYHQNGDLIIFTRDTHTEDYLNTNEGRHLPYVHCVKGTNGWDIVPGLEVPGCEYIDKPSFGWIHWDAYDFANAQIEIVGLCTDICVVSNALILKATFPEADITVDAKCCAGVTPESHKASLITMKMCQINVMGE